MKTYICIFIFVFLFSCQSNRKEEIARLVTEWQNKEIHFPQSSVFTIQAKDTIEHLPDHAPYKVVIYSDSLGCISCKLQLNKWKTFIEEVDSLTGKEVPFIFIMDTRNMKEMNHILRRDKFTYPVYIDTESRFNTLNHLPDDPAFHTFLLDENNRIRLIGNPIHNIAVKELFLNEFHELNTNK